MKKAKSYKELSDLIMRYFKKGVYTNCFITKEDFEFYIKNKRLFYEVYDGGLLIFIKMQGFFNLKFYINDFDCDFKIPTNKKIVVEVASRTEKDLEKIVEYLMKLGLTIVLNRIRFSCNEPVMEKNKIKNVEKVKLKDYLKIIKILRKNYDKYTGCIPLQKTIRTDIADGRFYCYKENKKILGILHVSKKGKISEMRHLAVLKEARGKHISKYLITKYLLETKEVTKQVWTSIDNDVAKNLFSSFGYKADGYVSKVLSN